MTCKDCIHYDLCRSFSRIQLGWHGNSVHYVENIEDICKDFKDRSRFVKLPCKHGDTLFRIINGKIEKGVATDFFYGSEFHIVNCRFPKISTGIPFHRFGKTVFLSKKEAEQALKEREA